MRKKSGFTLLELVIVVAIIGILSAIAIPSYQKYILVGHRADAKNVLQEAATELAAVRRVRGTYTAGKSDINDNFAKYSASSKFYNYQVSGIDATTYTLTATAKGGQINDSCQSFSLDQAGNQTANGKGAFDDASRKCWGQ